jgi:hypothetical protein
VQTIPRIGPVLGAVFLAEIGDITWASRTYGRFAVGLRPSLDLRASLVFTLTTSMQTRKRQPTRASTIDRRRSFRNDTKRSTAMSP